MADTFENVLWELLERFLSKAEVLYGPRDSGFSVVGFVFDKSGPQIHFEGEKGIVIYLGSEAKDNIDFAIYQLSHEIIHCLAPCRLDEGTILEEGLAVFFSLLIVREESIDIHVKRKCYKDACALLERYLVDNPTMITDLRKAEPRLYMLTKDHLLALNIGITESDAIRLTSKFVEYD